MRILLVSATGAEIASLAGKPHVPGGHEIDLLTTGVGMVATAARCSRALMQANYGLALNAGVCGSFDRAIGPGTVVHVAADRISELGAEDGDAFLTIQQMH